jgi:hypothetical protein
MEEPVMDRRDFIKGGAALSILAQAGSGHADVPDHRWDGYNFGPGPRVTNRLNQGPFGVEQDEGWFTIDSTTASDKPVRNFGLGLVGYTWEESGPSLAARAGKETLERHVEKLASLPFVDVLYIRCDWRDVQSKPGKLDLHPIWKLTFDAAKSRNLRVGFRVQLSSPNIQPKRFSMPDFLQERVPFVNIGRKSQEHQTDFDFFEPRYDHPEFQKGFRELNEMLAVEFDGNPMIEFMDLMMYGFWGEGHTNDLKTPFSDYLTAERTFVQMTQMQIDAWKKVPLAVNTEPDISNVGNREVHDMAVRAGSWLRSDSIIMDEPIQIEMLSNRPQWLAVIMEEGSNRHFNTDEKSLRFDAAGVNSKEKSMAHVLDLGGNYFSLWTEADNLALFHDKYPGAFNSLQRRIGYRIRPSWIWQRKRYDTVELIVAFVNDGVAGVPGVLGIHVETPDGKFRIGGNLDAGQPYAGRTRQASFILPKGMDGQKVILRAEIETKGVRRPVQWACAQPLNPDGSLTIQLKPNNDKNWRKGV